MAGNPPPIARDQFSERLLGKYKLICRLTTGGMSEIFLAFQHGHAQFRKVVAIKKVLPDVKNDPDLAQMFIDEARIMAGFNHPHIVQVFDLGVHNDELFLALEFVLGATLVEVARACRHANEPIPIGFSLAAIRDTALALEYAHTFVDSNGSSQPIIHRDVAAKNIMVTFDGVAKLLDFGIAKNTSWAAKTMFGIVKGTSGYMSPEQAMGGPLDHRTDIFSLGVVCHELLTGTRLFHSKKVEDNMLAVVRDDTPPPSRTNKNISPALDAAVLKALARRREERYPSAVQFARALEQAAGHLIWPAEQSAALIARFFSERRKQVRQLIDEAFQTYSPPPSEPSTVDAPEESAVPIPLSGPQAGRRHAEGADGAEPLTDPGGQPPGIATEDVPLVDGRSKTVPEGRPLTGSGPAAFLRNRWLGGLAAAVCAGAAAVAVLREDWLRTSATATVEIPSPPHSDTPKLSENAERPSDVPAEKISDPERSSDRETETETSIATSRTSSPTKANRLRLRMAAKSKRTSSVHPATEIPIAADDFQSAESPPTQPGANPDKPTSSLQAEVGELTLLTDLPATVLFKSQSLGTTPLAHANLPAGEHVLRLLTPTGQVFLLRVQIKAGAVTSVNTNLSTLERDTTASRAAE